MLLPILVFAQVAALPRTVQPVLDFPSPLDDSAAYQGYKTRFFRDAARNTVQVYLDREGRVVTLLADAEDESAGFTARDSSGHAATLRWADTSASVDGAGRRRSIRFHLAADADRLDLGWFQLGSMRVERDLQYAGKQRAPFREAPFRVAETERLVAALQRLDPAEQGRALKLLGARGVETLRARLQPTISLRTTRTVGTARVVQPSLDGRDTLVLEIAADPRQATIARGANTVGLRAAAGTHAITFAVTVTTTGRALTPLAREEIFTPRFLAFLDSLDRPADPAHVEQHARLERQVRGVELLVSREKLMAGLPNYATYFGRDMLVTALMMHDVWRPEMSAFAIAAALRKLGPAGDVSHEEALGGQAVREGAGEYAALVDSALAAARDGRRAAGDSLLARSRAVLGALRRTRENYHMIDDELQLAVLAGRWLADTAVSAARKRAFLVDSSDGGGTRAARLLRELGLVSRMTGPYAASGRVEDLISFQRRDGTHWGSASWRDSGAGYANGRYAMDVNAIWAPHALEATAAVLDALSRLKIPADSAALVRARVAAGSPLFAWTRDAATLGSATTAWWDVARYFLVTLDSATARSRVEARLSAMPAAERAYWAPRIPVMPQGVRFAALALDSAGQPIGVANSDVATGLFLGGRSAATSPARTSSPAGLFVLPYPAGLFVAGVGPVVANDAYATPDVWRDFERDSYHGPRVVWGREVNLFLLGALAQADSVPELRAAADSVLAAVNASGFHSELWSYEIRDGRVVPVRYGIASDVQLWSTTDLAVELARWRFTGVH